MIGSMMKRRWSHQGSMSCRRVVRGPILWSRGPILRVPIGDCRSPVGRGPAMMVAHIGWPVVHIEGPAPLLGPSSLAWLKSNGVLIKVII